MADLASRITKPEDKPADAVPAAPAAADATDATNAADAPIEPVETGLHEPEWDVEVSLSELQNNEATPFHSATSWKDLGLYE